MDGKITSADADWIEQYNSGMISAILLGQFRVADVNRNGVIDSTDLSLIESYITLESEYYASGIGVWRITGWSFAGGSYDAWYYNGPAAGVNEWVITGLDPSDLPTAVAFKNELYGGHPYIGDLCLTIDVCDSNGNELNDNDIVTTGIEVRLNDRMDTLIRTYYVVLFGDVDCNGKIQLVDTTRIASHVVGNVLLDTTAKKIAANVNKSIDGAVTQDDVALLQWHMLNPAATLIDQCKIIY